MPNVQGMIEKVYHNFKDRNDNLLSDDKINHKIKMEGELYIIKGKYCPDFVKEGKKVSITYNVWKPSHGGLDRFYVMTDKESNRLLINDLSTQQEVTPNQSMPDEEIPLDDNLEPDHLANMGVVDNSKTSFNHGDNVKISPNVDKKSIEMFVMAMTKSALESNQLKADSTSIDNFIGDMINIYQNRFI